MIFQFLFISFNSFFQSQRFFTELLIGVLLIFQFLFISFNSLFQSQRFFTELLIGVLLIAHLFSVSVNISGACLKLAVQRFIGQTQGIDSL